MGGKERERCRICPVLLFLFLKGMRVPWHLLVIQYNIVGTTEKVCNFHAPFHTPLVRQAFI